MQALSTAHAISQDGRLLRAPHEGPLSATRAVVAVRIGGVSEGAPIFGQDASLADWIEPRLTGRWGSVTATVPDGYPAYVRLLHPVPDVDEETLHAWWEIADEFGTTTHPLVQWVPLLGRPYDSKQVMWRNSSPDHGSLHPAVLAVLVTMLAEHTTTANDCWFCVWQGWGGFVPSQECLEASPTAWREPGVRLPGREYFLARGALAAALHLQDPAEVWPGFQSPNLFWPSDRAWCVASEIDFDSTLIAGSESLAAQLLHTDVLETWRVQPQDSLAEDADLINRY